MRLRERVYNDTYRDFCLTIRPELWAYCPPKKRGAKAAEPLSRRQVHRATIPDITPTPVIVMGIAPIRGTTNIIYIPPSALAADDIVAAATTPTHLLCGGWVDLSHITLLRYIAPVGMHKPRQALIYRAIPWDFLYFLSKNVKKEPSAAASAPSPQYSGTTILTRLCTDAAVYTPL